MYTSRLCNSHTTNALIIILHVFLDPHVNGSCDPGYFRCIPNGYCISNDLVCNGHPNCGDNDISDEDQCDHGETAMRHYGNLFCRSRLVVNFERIESSFDNALKTHTNI